MKFFHYEFNAMGTPCDIQLFAKTATRAKQVAELAIADVRRLEMRYSRYRGNSFLSKINRVAATGGSISVDPETAGLLNYAATCHQQSDGLFDFTPGMAF
jgi:thiamine biosynthesis lipoprotein